MMDNIVLIALIVCIVVIAALVRLLVWYRKKVVELSRKKLSLWSVRHALLVCVRVLEHDSDTWNQVATDLLNHKRFTKEKIFSKLEERQGHSRILRESIESQIHFATIQDQLEEKLEKKS